MTIPPILEPGDEVRVIAPARTLAMIGDREIATRRLEEFGLRVTFGKHVMEDDDFRSSSIVSRIEDLHDAFRDTNVKLVLTVIGGFNSNQLLRYIDWELIRNNPKRFCGYSDITALSNAIYVKTGLMTFSGPHYSTLAELKHLEYTLEYFERCHFHTKPIQVKPSTYWCDDAWYLDQENREVFPNDGWIVVNEGVAEGISIGGNLCTLNLLQGTEFMPSLNNTILFLEDDEMSNPVTFDRDLQSLIHQHDFAGVQGLLIGRFQRASGLNMNLLRKIIASKRELNTIPVVANVDFGHTGPRLTLPVGGKIKVSARKKPEIDILVH